MVTLNLGSGDYPLPGCINVDRYTGADVQADIARLPFRDGSVDKVQAHHVLEHFSRNGAFAVLKEWRRVLKQGGQLWVSVPDMMRASKLLNLVALEGQTEVWHAFLLYVYGSQEHEGQFHKWAYSPESLLAVLEQCGFRVLGVYPQYPDRPTPTFSILGEAV